MWACVCGETNEIGLATAHNWLDACCHCCHCYQAVASARVSMGRGEAVQVVLAMKGIALADTDLWWPWQVGGQTLHIAMGGWGGTPRLCAPPHVPRAHVRHADVAKLTALIKGNDLTLTFLGTLCVTVTITRWAAPPKKTSPSYSHKAPPRPAHAGPAADQMARAARARARAVGRRLFSCWGSEKHRRPTTATATRSV